MSPYTPSPHNGDLISAHKRGLVSARTKSPTGSQSQIDGGDAPQPNRQNPNECTPSTRRPNLWDVKQAAKYYRASESWVRRHLDELPHERRGRLIRFDPEALKRTVTDRKSLEPLRRLMPNNRYQRGGVYLRGKHKNTWYGTYRVDTHACRKGLNLRLGTKRELPTKSAAREKLREMVEEMTKSDGASPISKSMLYAELVEKWKQSEGPAMSDSTLEHYSNALRAYVLPTWEHYRLESIQREDVTNLLNTQAAKYSRSALRSMRVVLRLTLAWGERNGYIQRPASWLDGIKLPRRTGGRKLVRPDLEPSQTLGIIEHLEEPYATLVLFLALCGRRIEEAIGIKPTDLDDNNVLHIRRIIYNGRVEDLQEEQKLPLDQPEHVELIRRLRALGKDHEWVFRSRKGTPVNPGNARRRYLHPAAKAVGAKLSGWHDFRHSMIRTMRRGGVHPVVVSAVVGHKRIELAPEVYDRANQEEIRAALGVVSKNLLPIGSNSSSSKTTDSGND